MAHEISVSETSRGMAIVAVSGMPGKLPEMATLTPGERFELARALYPQAFEGDVEQLRPEYGVRDRNGRVRSTFEGRLLADLTAMPGEVIVTRNVGEWREASE
jgi:hypothetical protein